MKAVIMAGGEGTRLRPLTSNTPKPLIPLVNRPMMDHIVRLLKRHGFDEVVVTLAFLPQTVRSYFGDGEEFGVRMVYATEETPLGTAGSVGNAKAELDEPFLVISGDVLTDIDIGAIVDFHKDRGAMATIALKSVENPLEFGIVITREDGSIERFLEKPSWGQVFSDTVNTGIYVLEPEIFDFIPEGQSVDFSDEVFPALLDADKALFGYVADGYWEDVGTLDAYVQAHQDVLDGKVDLEVPGFQVSEKVWLGEGSEVDADADVQGPVVVGEHCRVEAGAHLGAYTVIGNNVMVRADASIDRSVVHENAYLAESVQLRGTVVGRSTDLRPYARCEEGVVLGDECLVGDHAVINPGVKVYPFKTVEAGAIVNSSIVWESRGSRTLFGRMGVSGLANVDVTPELAVRVAMAWGTNLKKGTTVTTSRDTSRAARALKRAMMAGFNATGINVEDLEMSPIPVTRFQVRTEGAVGGVTVRLVPGDAQSVTLRFFDADGTDLGEGAQRKIERAFHRQDFRRVFAADIGDIRFPPHAVEYYSAALMATVDTDAIRDAGFRVVMDYAFGSTSLVMPSLLGKLRADVHAINPFASTVGVVSYEKGAHATRVAEMVRASSAGLGAVIDPDGDHIVLVDDAGHVLSDEEALMALIMLVCRVRDDVRIALPVAVSRAAERIAADGGAEVLWTKLSNTDLMDVAAAEKVTLAASQNGGFIFPAFLPALDATAAFVNVLELLAKAETKLSEVVASLPKVHMAHETVITPFEEKGVLMRKLVERLKDQDVLLVDGVKVNRNSEWALMLPDPEEPVTHVWAEGENPARAQDLVREHASIVQEILG